MAKPWIGIPTRYHASSKLVGQVRRYLDAILHAGGLPLIIPTLDDPVTILEYAKEADGILLPGSPTDIDPRRYGAEPHEKLGVPYPERDATDMALLDYADRKGLPVLGICFGAQSLNVYRGGTLIQDIPSEIPGALAHNEIAGDPPIPVSHPVRLSPGSRLAGMLGGDTVEVNSFHHQAIGVPGRNLRVAALAPDGVVEAVEDVSGRFIVGVQWHPERCYQDDALARALLDAFVHEAGKSKSSSV